MTTYTTRARNYAIRLLVLIVVVAAWQSLSTFAGISSLVIAPPTSVWHAITGNFGQFIGAFGSTFVEITIASAASIVIGVLVGAVIGSSSLLYESMSPVLNASIAVPWILLYPVFMVGIGLGKTSQVAFGFVLGVAPVAVTSAASFRTVDPRYRMVARAWNATRWQSLTRVLIPASLPGTIAGARLGTALATIGVIVGQLLGSNSGLGFLISYYRTSLDTGQVYLGIFLALLLAYGFSAAMRSLVKRIGYQEGQSATWGSNG